MPAFTPEEYLDFATAEGAGVGDEIVLEVELPLEAVDSVVGAGFPGVTIGVAVCASPDTPMMVWTLSEPMDIVPCPLEQLHFPDDASLAQQNFSFPHAWSLPSTFELSCAISSPTL